MKVRINLCQDLEADHEAAALAEALAEADLVEADITAALAEDITADLAVLTDTTDLEDRSSSVDGMDVLIITEAVASVAF